MLTYLPALLVIAHVLQPNTSRPTTDTTDTALQVLLKRMSMTSDENATVVTLESTKTRRAIVASTRSLEQETYLLTRLPSDPRIEAADITTKTKTPNETVTARIVTARGAGTEKRRFVAAKSGLHPLNSLSMEPAEGIVQS